MKEQKRGGRHFNRFLCKFWALEPFMFVMKRDGDGDYTTKVLNVCVYSSPFSQECSFFFFCCSHMYGVSHGYE